MQKTFAMSCTEVYEIINSLPKAEFEKILSAKVKDNLCDLKKYHYMK